MTAPSTTEKCKICGHIYSPMCEWNQGRCPQHKALLDSPPKLVIPQPARDGEREQPDAKNHLEISLVKSLVRILAGLALLSGSLVAAGFLLIIAEGLGIAEELA